MIYLFYGSDAEKVRAKAFEWVAAARKKEPNLAYVRLAKEDLSESAILEAATSGSLFAKRTLTLIDDPFPRARAGADEEEEVELPPGSSTSKSLVDDHFDALAGSDNAIVLLAPALPAVKAKKLSAMAAKEYKFDKPAAKDFSRGFNSNLVNALGARDRAKLWLEVNRALRAGDAPEMLHGLLHWKARDLMEKGSRAWTPAEARALSLGLITLLQETRRKGLDLGERLECWSLTLL